MPIQSTMNPTPSSASASASASAHQGFNEDDIQREWRVPDRPRPIFGDGSEVDVFEKDFTDNVIKNPAYKSKVRLSWGRQAELRYQLAIPDEIWKTLPTEEKTPHARATRRIAYKYYGYQGTRFIRKAETISRQPGKEPLSYPDRYVVLDDGVYTAIKQVHLAMGHAGNKSYSW